MQLSKEKLSKMKFSDKDTKEGDVPPSTLNYRFKFLGQQWRFLRSKLESEIDPSILRKVRKQRLCTIANQEKETKKRMFVELYETNGEIETDIKRGHEILTKLPIAAECENMVCHYLENDTTRDCYLNAMESVDEVIVEEVDDGNTSDMQEIILPRLDIGSTQDLQNDEKPEIIYPNNENKIDQIESTTNSPQFPNDIANSPLLPNDLPLFQPEEQQDIMLSLKYIRAVFRENDTNSIEHVIGKSDKIVMSPRGHVSASSPRPPESARSSKQAKNSQFNRISKFSNRDHNLNSRLASAHKQIQGSFIGKALKEFSLERGVRVPECVKDVNL